MGNKLGSIYINKFNSFEKAHDFVAENNREETKEMSEHEIQNNKTNISSSPCIPRRIRCKKSTYYSRPGLRVTQGLDFLPARDKTVNNYVQRSSNTRLTHDHKLSSKCPVKKTKYLLEHSVESPSRSLFTDKQFSSPSTGLFRGNYRIIPNRRHWQTCSYELLKNKNKPPDELYAKRSTRWFSSYHSQIDCHGDNEERTQCDNQSRVRLPSQQSTNSSNTHIQYTDEVDINQSQQNSCLGRNQMRELINSKMSGNDQKSRSHWAVAHACGDDHEAKAASVLSFSPLNDCPTATTVAVSNSGTATPNGEDRASVGRQKTRAKHESMQPLNLLIRTLQKDVITNSKQMNRLKLDCQYNKGQIAFLKAKLNESRTIGLRLEAANGRFITEFMKNKYLQIEINQLTTELERRKLVFETKESEKRELLQELERLNRLRMQYERQCQEAQLKSNLTSQQLQDIHEKCNTMEIYRDEEVQLQKMLYNLQAALGRVRAFVLLRPTAHDSCIRYVSSSELIFTPPKYTSYDFKQSNQYSSDKCTEDEVPVLCRLSHIVQPGSCRPLEVFNEVSTTIDGVVDGLNACFVTVGPKQSGKSSTIFGESSYWEGRRDSTHLGRKLLRERRAYFRHLSTSSASGFMELTRSEEFASIYGLVGLCLVHLLQNVNLKTILDGNIDDAMVSRTYTIGLAIVAVPLNYEEPEFDLIANRTVSFTDSNLLSAVDNDQKFFAHQLEEQVISTVPDVIRACELVHHRLRHYKPQNSKHDPTDNKDTHKVMLIKVQGRPTGLSNSQRQSNQGGLLVLIDTVGLDSDLLLTGDSMMDEDKSTAQRSIRAWNDVAALAQAMRLNPQPNWFERTRLLRIIRPCILPGKSKSQRLSTACSLLLHLPCDKTQAYTTMQCLRLGLWVMQLDKEQDTAGQSNPNTEGATRAQPSEKCRLTCTWRIGSVGQPLVSTTHSTITFRGVDTSTRALELQRSNSTFSRIGSKSNTRGRRPEKLAGLQRTRSFG
ncbi:hypothetical protein EG68_05499 [Paragonimus skrjabini miyazakii]|uniref:Kinesin motor domain-containing protein n=1 Tax=Paragonimus skrjabini miyazakii TaxID=59628 RepID=A0A8S9YRD8_9TREM|nr:hypothetical protein EG68_05499 [Paragonimus skrjabini miyazakii]